MNVRHLTYLVGLLMIAILAIGARAWHSEHKSRGRTAAMAQAERQRSRILECINTSCALDDTLEKITRLVTFLLEGAPCWCRIADGRELGIRPKQIENPAYRIFEFAVVARNGLALGKISTALVGKNPSDDRAQEALAMAAGLATLAIETSNLYQDLVYRSEFDLLTDIPNRFSLEKRLEVLIVEAAAGNQKLGFIFVDLDRFKQINDRYGHQTGDVYLQQVAQRMKRQLRPGDVLARLGGDEFAVAVPAVRSRSEVEEIAGRLDRSFDEPFSADGRQIFGSASIGIALYPEDALTRDSLMNTADAAMYAIKHARRRHDVILVGSQST